MRADILSAALASSGDAAATIPAVRNFRRSIGLAAVTAFVAVSIPWADTSPCREPTGIMRCIIGIDNCLRFDVYVMAPLSHAFTQLKHADAFGFAHTDAFPALDALVGVDVHVEY